jgi:ankyrin repeat protein
MNWEIVLFCLTHGVDVNIRGRFGYRAIHCSLTHARCEMSLFLSSSQKVDLNCGTFVGDAPLFLIAQVEGRKILQTPNLKMGSADLGTTPLHIAAHSDFPAVLSAITERGVHDINVRDRLGLTALHSAAFNNAVGCIELLCRNRLVDIKVQDVQGRTAMDVALTNECDRAIALLKSRAQLDGEGSSDPESSTEEDE